MAAGYPGPSPIPSGTPPAEVPARLRQWQQVLLNLLQGRLNVTGTVELASGTLTVLEDPRLTAQSVLHTDALTAAAAGVTWWAADVDRGNGAWTLRHAAGPGGRVLRYAVLG